MRRLETNDAELHQIAFGIEALPTFLSCLVGTESLEQNPRLLHDFQRPTLQTQHLALLTPWHVLRISRYAMPRPSGHSKKCSPFKSARIQLEVWPVPSQSAAWTRLPALSAPGKYYTSVDPKQSNVQK